MRAGARAGDDDRRSSWPDVGDVIRSKTAAARPKDLDALPGLLRIARGRARARRDEMGGRAAHASMTFDVFASAAPARGVTRVTHRRQLSAPGRGRWPVSANQRSNTATGINTLTCVLHKIGQRKGTIITGPPQLSRHGSNTTKDKKKKAPQ